MIMTSIHQGRLCKQCNSRFLFKPCVRLRVRQIAKMFNTICIVCFVLERLESCDSVAVLIGLQDISTMTLNCDCHKDVMLIVLSSIFILGADNTRRLLFTIIV